MPENHFGANVYYDWHEWGYDDGDTLGDMVKAQMRKKNELSALTDEELTERAGGITGFSTIDPSAARRPALSVILTQSV